LLLIFEGERVRDDIQTQHRGKRWQGHIARFMRRCPWIGTGLQMGFRLFQPRFTIGVVGVLLDETRERVFLVEHVYHTHTPWGLPGGWMDRGEDPARTVEREFFEETNLRVRAVQPLLIQRSKWATHMDVVYLCEHDDPTQTIQLSHELLGFRWASIHDLPPLAKFHAQAIRVAGEKDGHR
jgi:8-oxo-dGTP diphosphatase